VQPTAKAQFIPQIHLEPPPVQTSEYMAFIFQNNFFKIKNNIFLFLKKLKIYIISSKKISKNHKTHF
jgi:hypothetical protein